MNRQARLHAPPDDERRWTDHGNVSLLEAARQQAIVVSRRVRSTGIFHIEVRCEDSPEIPTSIFRVQVSPTATVLNPRLDTDTDS